MLSSPGCGNAVVTISISFTAWVLSCRAGAVVFLGKDKEVKLRGTAAFGPWALDSLALAVAGPELILLWHAVREPQHNSQGFPLTLFTASWISAASVDGITGIEVQRAFKSSFLE